MSAYLKVTKAHIVINLLSTLVPLPPICHLLCPIFIQVIKLRNTLLLPPFVNIS